MPLSNGSTSVGDEEDLFFSEWPRVYALTDDTGAGDGTEVYLGAVKDGVLRTSRETTEFFGTSLIPKLELSFPNQVNMEFAGTAHELTYGLIHFLVGDARIDDETQYVYPGAACAFGNIDVTLMGERINCNDHMIVFRIHRARATGAIEIGSSQDVIGTPLEVAGINDEDGDFGGSSESPLGYVWFSHTA